MEWYFKRYYQFLRHTANIYNFNPFIYTSLILFFIILLILEIFKEIPYNHLNFSDIHKWKDEWKFSGLKYLHMRLLWNICQYVTCYPLMSHVNFSRCKNCIESSDYPMNNGCMWNHILHKHTDKNYALHLQWCCNFRKFRNYCF
jgi:hypothetical protein